MTRRVRWRRVGWLSRLWWTALAGSTFFAAWDLLAGHWLPGLLGLALDVGLCWLAWRAT